MLAANNAHFTLVDEGKALNILALLYSNLQYFPCYFLLESEDDGEPIDQSLNTAESTAPPLKLTVGTVYEGDIPSATKTSLSSHTDNKRPNSTGQISKEKREERKLAIMMMSKKRKRLFDQITKSRKLKGKAASELKRKRKEYDDSKLDNKRVKIS